MSEKRFTKDHEWIAADDGVATIGITGYAQEQLGDIVFVDLPEIGRALEKGGEAAVVESVKAASEVYAPVAGEVLEVNARLNEDPALVNSDAEGEGWFLRIRLADSGDLAALMDRAAYDAYLGELD